MDAQNNWFSCLHPDCVELPGLPLPSFRAPLLLGGCGTEYSMTSKVKSVSELLCTNSVKIGACKVNNSLCMLLTCSRQRSKCLCLLFTRTLPSAHLLRSSPTQYLCEHYCAHDCDNSIIEFRILSCRLCICDCCFHVAPVVPSPACLHTYITCISDIRRFKNLTWSFIHGVFVFPLNGSCYLFLPSPLPLNRCMYAFVYRVPKGRLVICGHAQECVV